jgi:hypothetical protein
VAERLGQLEERAAEREKELAEKIVTVMTRVLRDVLADLDLTPEQKRLAAESKSRHLRLMAAELRKESTS